MKKSKLFLLITIVLIFISSIIIISVQFVNNMIKNIDIKTQFLQEKIEIRDYNLNQFSNEALKGTTNYGFYYVLKELNSSKISDFDGKLKIEFINSIIILTEGEISRSELIKKSIPELNEIAMKKLDEYINVQSKDKKELSKFKALKESKEGIRDWLLFIATITQSIALVLGIIAEYIEIKGKKISNLKIYK